jgi:hypothetical protein
MRTLLTLLLWLCLAVTQLHAQTPTVPISGSVIDEKGAPLLAVTVTALTADKKVVITTIWPISSVELALNTLCTDN